MTPGTVPPRRVWWRQSLYRVGQFWRGLHATVTAQERARVSQVLPPAAVALFETMPRDAQRHSLDVLATLDAAGYGERALAAAALLHDVGKIAANDAGLRLGLWLRGPLVLLEALAPAWSARQARADPTMGWRYLLHVHVQHPAIGAAWAEQAGCDEVCCWLIAMHQTSPEHCAPGPWRDLLAALQWADAMH